MTVKQVLILGASGGTGRELVRQALEANLSVTAFVRDPARLTVSHPRLAVVRGDIGDAAGVAAAVSGHDAIVSALGVGKPLSADPVVVDGIRHTVRAMQQHGVQRLVYLSFMGVTESRSDAGFLVRFVARHPLRHEIADHEAKESLIRGSNTDWTIVRAPKLTNGASTGRYRSGVSIAARSVFPTLSRADVASFMIRVLLERTHVREAARILP
jgi:putative NADH-flavin reductase